MINIKLIEQRRKELKITKYRMADKLGMSRQTYYSILNKKSTSFKTLDRVAKVLNLKPGDLLL